LIRKVLVMAAMLLGVLSFAPAAHAQYQPGQPGIVLTPSTTTPGGAVSAIGFGCAPNQLVSLTIDGATVGTGLSQNDARGGFEIPFVAPNTPGTYNVTATCGNTVLSSVLTVIANAVVTTVTSGVLPATGSDSFPLLRVGFVLIAAGGLLVLAVRQRRSA
jgi:hypothetical protein